MNLLILYWKQIAVACAILGACLVGYYQGYSNEKVKFDAFKTELAIRAEAQKIQNDKIVIQQKQITTNVVKEYADAVKKLNAYYAAHPTIKWVRDTSAGAVSDLSNTAKSVDGEAESNLLSTVDASPLDCAADVLQLLYLQQWVRDQENVNR
jgi:urease accessory protein UreH